MREQAPDLAIQDADELPAPGHRDAEQLLGCQTERVFLVHRRDIVEPVEIGQRLQISLVLDQLLGPAVQQTDMRVDAVHDVTVELQYKAQYAVSRRMLGPEIEGEVAQGGFGHNGLASAAGSTLAADAGSRSIDFQFHRADVIDAAPESPYAILHCRDRSRPCRDRRRREELRGRKLTPTGLTELKNAEYLKLETRGSVSLCTTYIVLPRAQSGAGHGATA